MLYYDKWGTQFKFQNFKGVWEKIQWDLVEVKFSFVRVILS